MLYFFAALALLLRVFHAVSNVDLIWPDEHFQTLEPAFYLTHGFGLLPWEYLEHFRSWWVPLPYVPPLFLGKILGIEGLGLIYVARLYAAFLDLLSLWVLWRLLRRLGLGEVKRLGLVALWALSPLGVMWSVATLQDRSVALTLLFVFPFVLDRLEKRSDVGAWGAGFLASLPLLFKLPSAFAWLGLVLSVGLVYRARAAFYFALGICGSLSMLALLDKITYGNAAASLWAQVTQGNEISQNFGTSGFFYYFTSFNKIIDPIFLYLLVLGLVWLSGQKISSRAFSERNPLFWWLPFLTSLLALSLIPHKEFRFVVGSLPFFIVGLGCLWRDLRLPEKYHRYVRPVLGVGLLGWAGLSTMVLSTHLKPLSDVNLTALEERIRKDLKNETQELRCVALVDLHWSQTRGQMIVGRAFEYRRLQDQVAEGKNLNECSYMIVRDGVLGETKAPWSRLGDVRNGFVLLKNSHVEKSSR